MIVALVLAGGQATRMGGLDKALLPLHGATVLDALLARLMQQAGLIAISANGDPSRFARFGLPVLADPPLCAPGGRGPLGGVSAGRGPLGGVSAGRGPLGGVSAGLAWAASQGAASLLTVPGDTPFIPEDLVQRLGAAPAWAESGGAVHPLVALWPVEAAKPLAAWLQNRESLRVRDFGLSLGMRTVAFAGEPDPFLNINTPADLAQAERLGKRRQTPHLGP